MAEPGAADVGILDPATRPVRFVHNTVLSFLGLAVPLLVAFAVMPIIARNLGPSRFGLLALAWAVLEYLVVFDLGLGRATTRFVAESIGRSAGDLSQITAVSVAAQTVTGVIAGAGFALAAPFLATRVFNIDSALQTEAINMFRIVGLSLPVAMLLGTLRGVLEGAQRFDLSAAIKIPSSAAAIIIPAIGSVTGASLGAMLLWVLAARAMTCAVQAGTIAGSVPGFRWEMPREWRRLSRLLSFSGWVAVSSVASPLLIYFDRFVLGAIAGLAAVGYYTGPYEGVTRLLLIPVSLVGTLLPAMTQAEGRNARTETNRLLTGSSRNLLIALAPPLAVIFVFAPALLGTWLGSDYASQSSDALRFLAVGVMINTLAHPPYIALYAAGRPDLPAKFHVAELAFHIPVTWILVSRWGVTGAAAAWCLRVLIDTGLLYLAASRVVGAGFADIFHRRFSLGLMLGISLIGGTAVATLFSGVSSPIAAVVLVAALVHFTWMGWRRLMLPEERAALLNTRRWYLRALR